MVRRKHSNNNGSILLTTCALALSSLLTVGWLIIPNSPPIVGKTVKHISTKEKVVALTFDDGPNPPYTQQVLAVLKKHNVKATFFVVGQRAIEYPDVVQYVYKEGHELGNHTWSHRVLVGKSNAFIHEEIDKTDLLIRELGYTGPIHFRSPRGMKFIGLQWILSNQKRPNILFDAYGWDWTKNITAEKIAYSILKGVRHGSIILLHDGDGDHNDGITDRSQTVLATELIILALKEEGYRFITISELLNLKKGKHRK